MNEDAKKSRWSETAAPKGADYDARWAHMAAQGKSVHGEADFVQSLGPRSVLDAGCGTGRIAIELARRGLATVGVDVDEPMLEQARANAPSLHWVLDDLASVDVTDEGPFDCIVMAGNVMIFLAPGTEGQVLQNLTRHLADGGLLVAGFQLSDRRLTLDRYDELCGDAGLSLQGRFSTWDRQEFVDGGDYAVSLHGRANG